MRKKIFKKATQIFGVVMVAGLLAGCGKKAASDNQVNQTSEINTTEAPQLTSDHSEGATEYVIESRDVTKYVKFKGSDVNIVGSPIAEDAFAGEYAKIKPGINTWGVAEKIDKVSTVRDGLDYNWKYEDSGEELSSLPVKVEFGRGIVSGKADILASFSDEDNEKKRSELTEKYGNEEGEELYLKYLNQSRIYTANLYYVYKEKKEMKEITCAYVIDGGKIHFQEIEMSSDFSVWKKSFSEDFSYNFDGINLELSGDKGDMYLYPNYSMNSEVERSSISGGGWEISGVALDKESTLEDMANISIYEASEENKVVKNLIFLTSAKSVEGLEAIVGYDGDITIRWSGVRTLGTYDDKDTAAVEIKGDIIGFSSRYTGVTFIVDNKAYVYTNYSDNYKNLMTKDIVTVDEPDDEKMEEIMDKQAYAADKINESVNSDSLNMLIDATSGEATVNGGVLFETDKSELNDEGRKVLDDFLNQYVPVIEELKKDGTIEGIQVTGHTDSTGGYEHNMNLSEERAENVLNYVIEKYPEMKDSFSSKGIAYDDLIYNADGTENKDASRRVTFRLIIQ